MERRYLRTWSPALGRDMEMLRFGLEGLPVLAFPTSEGRFYQWEDFGLVAALADRLEAGRLQLWCVDSVDRESWYARERPPAERVRRHLEYERHLVFELVPTMPAPPVLAGPSFGAFHSVLTCLRHPGRLRGFVGLSGVYDNSRWLDSHHDDETYFTNPLAFLPGLDDEAVLAPLRAMPYLVVATGQDDANNSDSVRLGEELRRKGIAPRLDIWPGWAHDWPFWKDMLRTYLE